MSEKEQQDIAKRYVNEQLEIIKNYRAAKAEIPKEEYEKVVKKVAEAILCK